MIAAARALRRPVKWIEERSESFTATTHGRDQVADLELAADADGNITAMRGTVHASFGAYFTPNAPGSLLGRLGPMLPQGYRIEHFDVELVGVFANTTPIGPYRGAGRPEAAYFTERLVDLLAREMRADPAELRRRNFIPAGRLPVHDGHRPHLRERRLPRGPGPAAWRSSTPRLARTSFGLLDPGQLLGRGIATFVEPGGIVPRVPGPDGTIGDKATVTVGADGKVTVAVGTSGHGQGHETAFAQLAADLLGVRLRRRDGGVRRHRHGAVRLRHVRLPVPGGGRHRDPQRLPGGARRGPPGGRPDAGRRGGGPPRRHLGDRLIAARRRRPTRRARTAARSPSTRTPARSRCCAWSRSTTAACSSTRCSSRARCTARSPRASARR